MTERRRRRAVLIVAALALVTAATGSVAGRPGPSLRVTDEDGRLLASVPLDADATFGLRYRNSLYGTLAEERFLATRGGIIRLTGLRAAQLAVLEEYYAIDSPASRASYGPLRWSAAPAMETEVAALRLAATDLGQRTLIVAGREPLALWRLVDDTGPHVTLTVVP